MHMTRRPALALLLAASVLAGCGEADGDDPAPAPEVTSEAAAVQLVDEDDADLVLHASNQSFDDGTVRMIIVVDGVTVVDGDFHVGNQHNWVAFPLSMSPGSHEVMATTDSGAQLRETFETPGDRPRYAVIDYWGEGDSAELSWLVQKRPLAFA